MTHTQQKSPNLWLVITAAAAILLITIGMRMTMGLFVRPIVDSTELSIQEFSLIIAVFQLMWGLSQPLSGALADRFGAFKVLGGGALLLVCACLMVPQMPTYWGLMLAIGLLFAFGTGAGGFSIIMGQVAAKVPPHKRGLASGLVNAGGSAGQFLFAPLVQGLLVLPAVGWTGTFYVWGGIALLILPISWWLAGGKNAVATHHTSSENGQSLGQAVKAAFKDRSYILLHLGFFTCGFHIAFLVTHLPNEIALCGLPASVASTSIAIIGLANIAGCIFSGWCTGRFLGKYVLFGLYASRVAMVLIYLAAPRTDVSRCAGLHLARHRRPDRCDYGQTVRHALFGDAVRADDVEPPNRRLFRLVYRRHRNLPVQRLRLDVVCRRGVGGDGGFAEPADTRKESGVNRCDATKTGRLKTEKPVFRRPF